ncbi:Der GTPase-activating protein YihI [Vibrio agarivorans]|uniref:Der GTPase-activating protein YihI n=1 Tax=Vibrio agarivorans TaxID=153622 RepID=A0ABT7XVR9_9VIBR|nr:Der GTPase-activating protein YihI [Vibrio agarivorans]MDN2479850.1 Der GTPase-activating protein YihI [Vibrio agarivorans]
MSRTKKARSGGNLDVIVVRNRTQSDVEGRERKRLKKRKGLKTGNRNSDAKSEKAQTQGQQRDPRLGSKKKIPLIVEAPKKKSKAERRVSAEQELAAIENDAQFLVLLDRLENGEKLGAGLQKYVDQKMDRMEVLMKQLGIYEEDQEEEDFEEEADVVEQPKKVAKRPATDEDLLSQFEDLDLNDFKG